MHTKQKSLKINFTLNTTRLILNLVIPLITFPYIARVLGPECLGKVEFANSIVSYFAIFAALGIPTYGVREIARIRDNKDDLSHSVAEISVILTVSVLVCYFFYFLLILCVPKFHTQMILFLIVAPNVLLQAYNYEWFYKGIEDQLYITTRFILMKFLQIVSIFLFVKNQSDYYIYAIIYVTLNGVSTVFYLIRLKKYVNFVKFRELNIKRHIKPILIIFSASLATTIYMHLDVTMIGIFVNDTSVGLYSTANKLIRIVISLVTSLASVMVPRLAYNFANNQMETYRKNLYISFNFILLIGVPCIFGLIALSTPLVILFAGNQYIEASFTMKLLSPVILIVGLSYFIGLQVLYTNRKEKIYTIAVSISALLNFLCNIIFIPIFKHNGAVIGTLIAELSGVIVMTILGKSYLKGLNILSWKELGYIISSVLMFLVLIFVNKIFHLNIFILLVIGCFVYFSILVIWMIIIGLRLSDIRKMLKEK